MLNIFWKNTTIKLTLINSHDSGEESQNISFSDEEIVIDFDEKQEESEEYYEDVIFQTGKRSSSLTVIHFWESNSENTGGPPLTRLSLLRIPLPPFLAYERASGGFSR